MKLIYCPQCQDIVLLRQRKRTCACTASWGEYIDKRMASIGGMAIALGIDNHSFVGAMRHRPLGPGLGRQFDAFVIPMVCPTVQFEYDQERKDEEV